MQKISEQLSKDSLDIAVIEDNKIKCLGYTIEFTKSQDVVTLNIELYGQTNFPIVLKYKSDELIECINTIIFMIHNFHIIKL